MINLLNNFKVTTYSKLSLNLISFEIATKYFMLNSESNEIEITQYNTTRFSGEF
jgi:hypothetical protein